VYSYEVLKAIYVHDSSYPGQCLFNVAREFDHCIVDHILGYWDFDSFDEIVDCKIVFGLTVPDTGAAFYRVRSLSYPMLDSWWRNGTGRTYLPSVN
jgi:hypothetical protein